MATKKINLEEFFKYHPPTTQERIEKHNAINNAAYNFAEIVLENVSDEDSIKLIMNHIQTARMFCNQSIVIEEIRGANS